LLTTSNPLINSEKTIPAPNDFAMVRKGKSVNPSIGANMTGLWMGILPIKNFTFWLLYIMAYFNRYFGE
jgi:hypothetical protein